MRSRGDFVELLPSYNIAIRSSVKDNVSRIKDEATFSVDVCVGFHYTWLIAHQVSINKGHEGMLAANLREHLHCVFVCYRFRLSQKHKFKAIPDLVLGIIRFKSLLTEVDLTHTKAK
jgi:hypothetical protein